MHGFPGPLSGVAPGAGPGEIGTVWNGAVALAQRNMPGREARLGSAFNLSQDSAEGGPILTVWGGVEASGFDDEEMSGARTARVGSESTTGNVGADAAWSRVVAGISVSSSGTKGKFEQPGAGSGTAGSRLTTVSTFAQFVLNERVFVWGLLGYGAGETSTMIRLPGELGPSVHESRTDVAMLLGAVGARRVLRRADEPGGMDLAVNADVFVSETESREASNPVAARSDANRLQLFLEASRSTRLKAARLLLKAWNSGFAMKALTRTPGQGWNSADALHLPTLLRASASMRA